MPRIIWEFEDRHGRGTMMQGCPLGNLYRFYCDSCPPEYKKACMFTPAPKKEKKKTFWEY